MFKIIGADLKEYGPVSAEQLRLWVMEGRVNANTRIKPEGGMEWRVMSEFHEFADILPKAPPPAPAVSPIAPISPLAQVPRNNQLAIWSLVCGILAMIPCCGCIGAPLAIIFGAIALSQLNAEPHMTGRGFAITGIVLGILGILAGIAGYFLLGSVQGMMPNLQNIH